MIKKEIKSLDLNSIYIKPVTDEDLKSDANNTLGPYSEEIYSKIESFTRLMNKFVDHNTYTYYLFYFDDNIIIESCPAETKMTFYKNLLCHRDNDLPAEIYYGKDYIGNNVTILQWYKNGKLYRDNNKCVVFSETKDLGKFFSWYKIEDDLEDCFFVFIKKDNKFEKEYVIKENYSCSKHHCFLLFL